MEQWEMLNIVLNKIEGKQKGDNPMDTKQTDLNAHLTAAAPDLLAIAKNLKDVYPIMPDKIKACFNFSFIEAAIAKAEGRTA